MNQRQKIAHAVAIKHRIQFASKPMDLGIALMDHQRLLPGQKCHFQDARDFMEEVNEELSILDGERGSNEQPGHNTRISHRAH